MIIRQRIWCKQFSWKYAALAIVMAVLLISLITLLFHLSAKGQQDLSYSKAEPVRQGDKVIIFPFQVKDWTSSSRPCPKHYFPCNTSRQCLILDKRCDGVVDCPKAEDEQHCACAFRMPQAKFCDKYPDCFDESDENFCSYCPEGYFNCGNGYCIPRNKVCDSEVDCENFMDENFCFSLSSKVGIASVDNGFPTNPTNNEQSSKTGFLLRNKNGIWYPVCANPHDYMQDALASFACVSITANPLAGSKHHFIKFAHKNETKSSAYIYHYLGRFVQWQGCLTDKGIFVACDDVRCGLNPKHFLPRRPRGRIVGGELSEPGAWPWHAAIYKNGSYACGATLINSWWLISAAHCFLNHRFNYYEIQLGMLRRRSFTPHQKTYRIVRVKTHPKFNIITLDYDIVMLKTDVEVMFDFWVRPICLPNPKKVENSGSFCTAIGWGDTGELEGDSDDLQEVHVPLTKSCKKNSERWLCAGFVEGGRDACQGDSGGPLMCQDEGGLSWYIAGVISGGTGCARPHTPGMYTRVAYYLDWIKETMQSSSASDIHPLFTCPGFKCAVLGGGYCLHKEKLCDGHVDCYDTKDEVNCTKNTVVHF